MYISELAIQYIVCMLGWTDTALANATGVQAVQPYFCQTNALQNITVNSDVRT
jgi:hypothetical protein